MLFRHIWIHTLLMVKTTNVGVEEELEEWEAALEVDEAAIVEPTGSKSLGMRSLFTFLKHHPDCYAVLKPQFLLLVNPHTFQERT